MSNMYQKLKDACMTVRWNIAILNRQSGNLQEDIQSAVWLKHNYTEGWFADPFILSVNDDIIEVLVEEYRYDTKRGRISLLLIDRKTCVLKEVRSILQLDTHLSFPAILRYNDEVYVYPENSESGKLTLYKLNKNHTELASVSVICNSPLTDAIMEKINGKLYLFSTVRDNPNGDELAIYEILNSSDINKFEASYVKTVKFPCKSARNGGNFIRTNDITYKVSQDCNEYYGKGLVFYKMMDIDVYEKAFRHYEKGKVIGCHTYNEYRGIGVIDGKTYKYGLFARILHYINKFVRI